MDAWKQAHLISLRWPESGQEDGALQQFSYMSGLRSVTVRKVCEDVHPCVPAKYTIQTAGKSRERGVAR